MEDIRVRWLQCPSRAANRRPGRSCLGTRFRTRLWPLVALGLVVAILASACSGESKGCQADGATAAESGSGERIAFISADSPSVDGGNLNVINRDGSGLRCLDLGGETTEFAWSPDGHRIAHNRGHDLYAMELESFSAIQLTDDSGLVGSLTWSPDGTQIAFLVGRELFVTYADDPFAKRLAENVDIQFSWSPDSDRIAFRSTEEEILVARSDGSDGNEKIRLVEDVGRATWPAWSPDGTRIAFLSMSGWGYTQDLRSDIYVGRVDGVSVIRVTGSPSSYVRSDLAWSPDGTQILTSRSVVNYDPRITEDPVIHVLKVDSQLERSLSAGRAPVWSPDGQRIAFFAEGTLYGGGIRAGGIGIHVIDVDGSNEIALTDQPNDGPPTWSPDGTQIAFSRAGDIYVANADGSGEMNITNSPDATDSNPAWAPQ